MDKYGIKIILVSTWGYGFDRMANKLFAEAVEQGYRFNSASPLDITQDPDGKKIFSQTFVFEKGEKK